MKIDLTPKVIGHIQSCLEWTLEEPGYESDRETAAIVLEATAPLVEHLPDKGMVSIPRGKKLVEVVLSEAAIGLIYRANEDADAQANAQDAARKQTPLGEVLARNEESIEASESVRNIFGAILQRTRSLS
jgi:hypothetical protein